MILINPTSYREKTLGVFAEFVPRNVPIAVATLAAALLEKGHRARIIDEDVTVIDAALLEQSARGLEEPYIFGISCLTLGMKRAFELSRVIKTVFPKAYVVFGGIHPTALPEESLSLGTVDIVARGEADETVCRLYESLKKGTDFRILPGISYEKDGGYVHNESAPLVRDINALPPFPYHLFDEHAASYLMNFVLVSRGCPYGCIFCSQRTITGRTYRRYSDERIISDLHLVIEKYKQKNILFFDDNFVVTKEATKAFLNKLVAQGLPGKANFSCQLRGDVVDDELVVLFKEAGFKSLNFGIESGSERIMKIIDKGETVQDNVRAIKIAARHGIGTQGTIIFGFPGETGGDRRKAVELVKEIPLDRVRFNNVVPYPGTPLYGMVKASDRLKVHDHWQNFNVVSVLVHGLSERMPLPFVPEGTTDMRLKYQILSANLAFMLKPSKIIPFLFAKRDNVGWFHLPHLWYLNLKYIKYMLALIGKTTFHFIQMVCYGFYFHFQQSHADFGKERGV